ncbi:cytochrome P450 [Truncatella angustata]|uniref:Cytochrome P450 n=1 Tax=Truncatella angustata TaxID=152316 RepID=A0A9P8UBW5_9PEZI|nr:cytochrome P450 [Truncatella angustata]KAH6645425.1 cytochrome P450 [Truncatella angustata]
MSHLITILCLLIVTWSAYKIFRIGRRPSDYPPGPPTLPILGNLHQMPTKDPHIQFRKWSKEYGSIYSVMAGTRTVIVLNTDEVVKELLDKRGAIYSSRPDSYIIDLVTGGSKFGLMPYNNTWKSCRAVFKSNLSPESAKTYVPYQDLESKQMSNDLLQEPEHFKDHIRRFTNSIAYQIVLGFRVVNNHDSNLRQVYESFEKWNSLLGHFHTVLLDLYPPLRQLPNFLVPIRKYAKEIHDEEENFFQGHLNSIKEKVENGMAQPCLAEDVIKAQEANGFPDELASMLCGDLIEAGSDTMANELMGFVLAMVLFPEVQKRAQAEIDRVCGDRLPELDDNLPYVRACVKETYRWMPTAILGIPHAVTQDDYHLGYKIPKGAIIIPNVWAIHMDERRHPEPRAFEPSRYLGDESTARQSAQAADPKKRDHFSFGAGRRLCVGIDLAENGTFLGVSRLLWAFDISKAADGQGTLITPDPEKFTGGMAACPEDFPARFTPRSERHARIIRSEWEDAQQELNKEDMQWKDLPTSSN